MAFPERSKRRLVQCVGPWWLWLHGAVQEHRVKLYSGSDGWYCIDIAVPNRWRKGGRGVEAKGGWRKYYDHDIVRDQTLGDAGWKILRVTEAEMHEDPKGTRRRVREFLR
jgi:hypothetical protein